MFYHEDIKECFSTLADIDIPAGLSVQLCWECLAAVRRAWQFRSQLLKSYDILNCYSRKHTFLNSPSDLTQYSTTRLSLSEVEINEDTEFQPVLLKEDIDVDTEQVKLELEDDLVDIETLNTEDQIFDHDEDLQPEDFSQEPEPSSEDDVQLSKLKEMKERKKVRKRRKSNKEEVLHFPKKRESDNENETEKEILKSQEPLKKPQNEDNKKITDLKIRSKKCKTLIKTIIPKNETTSSNINSDIKKSKIEANSNEQVTAPNNIFICDVCKKEYLCKSLLKNHIKKWHIIKIDSKPNSRTGEKLYKCSNYSKSFTNSGTLAAHVKTHTGEKTYKCTYCTKCFARRGNLEGHVKIHTGEKPHKCSYCTKCFITKRELETHVRTHTGELPYKCTYCNKSFTSKGTLARHVRIHTEQKPYKCSYCIKCFIQSSDLAAHVRIHTGEKPYKCSYCIKCFTHCSTLAAHVRIHTEEKPYKCSYCMKCFTQNNSLTEHVTIHTGEKPHKCRYCVKSFTQRSHLYSHVKNIHSEENDKKP